MKIEEFDKELEKAILEFDYNLKIEKMTNSIHQELSNYEALYQCLCCNYSDAYLKGSKWYVGDRLTDWFYDIESTFVDFRKKFEKYGYIKEILDTFMEKDDSFDKNEFINDFSNELI